MAEKKRNDTNGWLLNPGYEIGFDSLPARVRIVFGGAAIADSDNAKVMYELGHAPIYYLPRNDVQSKYLEATDHDTYCPYKGHASYWTVRVGDAVTENAIWTYAEPHAEVAWVKGYLGFYWGKMEAWYEDETLVPGPREIPGRIDTTTQLKKLLPELAAEWHPTRNIGISPYEFSPTSATVVWWRDAHGREWQARIRDRVIASGRLRTDGDAHPYD